MKREPSVKFKWASLKLRSMQHIAKLPPLPTDSTRCYVTYKLARREAAERSPQYYDCSLQYFFDHPAAESDPDRANQRCFPGNNCPHAAALEELLYS
ncbi:hypothetical protein PAMP_016182 [Pampus punctatissimus]